MSDEPKKVDETESRWQPVGVVSMGGDEPKKRRWALIVTGQAAWLIPAGIGALWTAHANLLVYVERADRPLGPTYIVPLIVWGAIFLTVGGVLFGYAMGSRLTNSRANREKP